MTIKIKVDLIIKDKVIKVSFQEAKEIYFQLKALFPIEQIADYYPQNYPQKIRHGQYGLSQNPMIKGAGL